MRLDSSILEHLKLKHTPDLSVYDKDTGFMTVDPSLRSTGICVVHRGHKTTCVINTKGLDRVDALIYIYDNMRGLLVESNVFFPLVVVEGYSFGSMGNAFTKVIEAGAAVRMACYQSQITVVEVPPSRWKKEAVLKGNANKKYIQEYVAENHQKKFATTDECDAWCILLACVTSTEILNTDQKTCLNMAMALYCAGR